MNDCLFTLIFNSTQDVQIFERLVKSHVLFLADETIFLYGTFTEAELELACNGFGARLHEGDSGVLHSAGKSSS